MSNGKHTISHIEGQTYRSAFIGDIDMASIRIFEDNISPLLAQATAENPIQFLADCQQEGKWDRQSRSHFTKTMGRDPRLGKIAMINLGPLTRVAVIFMTKATGRDKTVRYFDSEEHALSWLRE